MRLRREFSFLFYERSMRSQDFARGGIAFEGSCFAQRVERFWHLRLQLV